MSPAAWCCSLVFRSNSRTADPPRSRSVRVVGARPHRDLRNRCARGHRRGVRTRPFCSTRPGVARARGSTAARVAAAAHRADRRCPVRERSVRARARGHGIAPNRGADGLALSAVFGGLLVLAGACCVSSVVVASLAYLARVVRGSGRIAVRSIVRSRAAECRGRDGARGGQRRRDRDRDRASTRARCTPVGSSSSCPTTRSSCRRRPRPIRRRPHARSSASTRRWRARCTACSLDARWTTRRVVGGGASAVLPPDVATCRSRVVAASSSVVRESHRCADGRGSERAAARAPLGT